MKSHVAIYKTHNEALKAVQRLSERKFPMEHVSLIGKADIVEDHLHMQTIEDKKLIPFAVAIVLGGLFGLLLGLDWIQLPGMNFDFSDGFFVSIFFGLSIGLMVGAIATIVTALIIPKDKVLKYKEHLFPKRFLVVVNGTEEEILMAEKILHTEGMFKAIA